MQELSQPVKQYFMASDFDQTLSFNDSGVVLSELVEIPAKVFERKAGSADRRLCQRPVMGYSVDQIRGG